MLFLAAQMGSMRSYAIDLLLPCHLSCCMHLRLSAVLPSDTQFMSANVRICGQAALVVACMIAVAITEHYLLSCQTIEMSH